MLAMLITALAAAGEPVGECADISSVEGILLAAAVAALGEEASRRLVSGRGSVMGRARGVWDWCGCVRALWCECCGMAKAGGEGAELACAGNVSDSPRSANACTSAAAGSSLLGTVRALFVCCAAKLEDCEVKTP